MIDLALVSLKMRNARPISMEHARKSMYEGMVFRLRLKTPTLKMSSVASASSGSVMAEYPANWNRVSVRPNR